MRVYLLTCLICSCSSQRSYSTNQRYSQGGGRYPEAIPQSGARLDRYFNDPDWSEAGFDGWGMRKPDAIDLQEEQPVLYRNEGGRSVLAESSSRPDSFSRSDAFSDNSSPSYPSRSNLYSSRRSESVSRNQFPARALSASIATELADDQEPVLRFPAITESIADQEPVSRNQFGGGRQLRYQQQRRRFEEAAGRRLEDSTGRRSEASGWRSEAAGRRSDAAGEEQGVRGKRPKRIRVAGVRLNAAQNYNSNTDQSEPQADRADISQRTRWQTRDGTADSQTTRWLENEREKLVESQSARWQDREDNSNGQPRWQNRQYIDREEYRLPVREEIYRPAPPSRNLIKVQDVTEGVAKVLDVNSDVQEQSPDDVLNTDSRQGSPFFQLSTPGNSQPKQHFDDHPGSLSFGLGSTPSVEMMVDAAFQDDLKDSIGSSESLPKDEVTQPSSFSPSSTRAQNPWTTFGLEDERDKIKEYLEQTPVVVEEDVYEQRTPEKDVYEQRREKIQQPRIKPKRWNADFERFKEKSGMKKKLINPIESLPVSKNFDSGKKVRQGLYNKPTYDREEGYRPRQQNYKIRPRTSPRPSASNPTTNMDRFDTLDSFEAQQDSIRQRFSALDDLNKEVLTPQANSNTIRRQDSLRPFDNLDQFLDNPFANNDQDNFRRRPNRRPILRQRPTEPSYYNDRVDDIQEIERIDVVEEVETVDSELEEPAKNQLIIEEKSKEGQGEYGPFFNIDVPDNTDNIPFTEIKVIVEEPPAEVPSSPALFLPTMAPVQLPAIEIQEKIPSERIENIMEREYNVPFKPSPEPFVPEVIPDMIDRRIDVFDEDVNEEDLLEYSDSISIDKSLEEPNPSDFITGNPEMNANDYDTFKEEEVVDGIKNDDYEKIKKHIKDQEAAEAERIEKESETMKKVRLGTRSRLSSASATTKAPVIVNDVIDEVVTNTPSTTELPSAGSLENLLEENEYSKTHIRLQKLRPRVDTKFSSEKTVTTASTSSTEENFQEENTYSKTTITRMKVKKTPKAFKDYSDISVRDITKKIPVFKINKLLKKHGYKVSDMFNKVPEVMEIVLKAVDDDIYLESQLAEASMEFDSARRKEDQRDNEEDSDQESTNENRFRMPWSPRLTEEKTYEKKDDKKATSPVVTNEVEEESSFDAKLEEEVNTMDLKSLMKRISPMSIVEVLQKVGFSMPDIMSKNKDAIRSVLKYHYRITEPKQTESKKEISTKRTNWRPKIDTTSTTTVSSTSTTEESTTAKESYRRKSSIDLFRKFRNKLSVPTEATTTEAANMVTPLSNFRFGERTTKKRFTSIDDYRKSMNNDNDQWSQDKFNIDEIEEESTEVQEKDIFDNPNTLTMLDPEAKKELMEQEEELRNLFETDIEPTSTTTTSEILNQTLANFNMTDDQLDELRERKDFAVPDLNNLFNDIERESIKDTEIIYGSKTSTENGENAEVSEGEEMEAEENTINISSEEPKTSEKPKRKRKGRPKYIQMDFGPGGYRGGYNNPFEKGWGGGGGKGGLVTDRRTTTTTRATPPITYFDVNGDLVEDNIKLQSLAEESLLGDYEILDYDQYYEDYNHQLVEVPESVRSALIVSSVVGGLAVILFLAIFMLCLWKQMKSKLRMNGEFQEERVGFFASLFGDRKKEKDAGAGPNGYFNKVGSTTEHLEPNYSTTSSDEY